LDIDYVSNYSKEELFYPLIDIVWGIIFVTGCSLPLFTRGVFGVSNNLAESEFQGEIDSVPMDVFHFESESNEPQPFTEIPIMDDLGEDMGRFDITRPVPPKRRRLGQGSFYEILFLVIALILWPIATAGSIMIVGAVSIPGSDLSFSADDQGLIMMMFLWIPTLGSTIACYNLDKGAREGDVYAKEKAAYHRDMDQYLKLKEAYYRRHASKVSVGDETDEE
jgi:hypothetical protein